MQDLVNHCPDLLNREIAPHLKSTSSAFTWLSPLECDGYAEYRDSAFVERLGIDLSNHPLGAFWPQRGPVWDGLGTTDRRQPLLLEAKAHVKEINSSPTSARGKSLARIRESLSETKLFMGSKSGVDWATCFYQYTNRLAHLYLMREKNKLDAYLIFLYFLNAREMSASDTLVPETKAEWESAITLMERFLGLPTRHKLSPYIIHAFVDTADIEKATQ